MRVNFDEIIDRRNTWSSKWDVKEGELPLSTADMDFKTAPEIIEALKKRVEHGIFGYTDVADEWKESVIAFYKRRHHLKIEKDDLMFCTGVIPAISSTVRKLTTPAEKIVLLTPVYNIFFNSILNNGRIPLESLLIDNDGYYTIDFADLEAKLKDPQATMMILCNPHNPVGRIWKKEELAKIGKLCKENGVIVLSDEIHCDLVDPGLEYTPFASVDETCKDISITCIAPSKTFNLAGLQSSAIIVYNKALKARVNRAINTDEVAEPNAFAMCATITAYEKCDYWLDELREYIYQNKLHVSEFINREIDGLKVLENDATYLLWIDHAKLKVSSIELARFLKAKTGLILSDGSIYHGDGLDHLRMNCAYPRKVIDDALERLKRGIAIFREGR